MILGFFIYLLLLLLITFFFNKLTIERIKICIISLSGGLLAYVSLLTIYFEKSISEVYLGSGVLSKSAFLDLVSLDGLSIVFLLLTCVIFPSIYIYSNEFVRFSFKFHTKLLLFIQIITILSFITNNFLVFYFLFESLLFPLFILIGIWGSRGRKIHAAYQFFFFTTVSSVFILLGIFIIFSESKTLNFKEFYHFDFSEQAQLLVGILFFIGFMAKIPSLPLHIWLPEAHVEAPTVGSVILAALILKFGFYGMVRTILPICSTDVLVKLTPFFFLICLISLIYSSIAAVRQIDLKKIIAYSSVAHMNFSLIGIFLMVKTGLVGATFLMFSHGLISGAMFFCIGFLYERFHVRNIIYFGGLSQFMPIFSSIFLIVMFSNMSLPGTCNFIGEFMVFLSIYKNGKILLAFSLLSVLLVSIFSLVVLSRVVFYQITGFLYGIYDLNFSEFLLIIVLVIYIVVFGLFPNLLISLIQFV